MSNYSGRLSPAFDRLVDRTIAAKGVFLIFSCLVMAFTFLFVVVLRYGFGADLFAYEEWLLIICFWLYFIGGAVGTYEQTHVSADLLSYVIRDRRLTRVRLAFVNVVEFLVCLAVIYWAVLMLLDEIAAYPRWQTTIALQIPFLVPRVGILVGFAFMAFYSALHLYVLLRHDDEGAAPGNANTLPDPPRDQPNPGKQP